LARHALLPAKGLDHARVDRLQKALVSRESVVLRPSPDGPAEELPVLGLGVAMHSERAVCKLHLPPVEEPLAAGVRQAHVVHGEQHVGRVAAAVPVVVVELVDVGDGVLAYAVDGQEVGDRSGDEVVLHLLLGEVDGRGPDDAVAPEVHGLLQDSVAVGGPHQRRLGAVGGQRGNRELVAELPTLARGQA